MKNNIFSRIFFYFLALGVTGNAFGMGLRSFVALPVETHGAVMRLTVEHAENAASNTLTASAAYGLSEKQTLLLGLPYRLPGDRLGDLSALYRHILWREDTLLGTNRLGILGGAIVPMSHERGSALQAGLVFTHFKNRNEIDLDALYQAGMDSRRDSGRYDLSWQHRLAPAIRPDWGMTQEWNSVLELNGRWKGGHNSTHQITLGLQRVSKKWVLEGGIVKDINGAHDLRYVLSTRFHL